MNCKKTNWKLIENITVEVPNNGDNNKQRYLVSCF